MVPINPSTVTVVYKQFFGSIYFARRRKGLNFNPTHTLYDGEVRVLCSGFWWRLKNNQSFSMVW